MEARIKALEAQVSALLDVCISQQTQIDRIREAAQMINDNTATLALVLDKLILPE